MDFIISKLDEIYYSIKFNIFDILQVFLLVYMCWCCYCIMMNRDKLSIPPFGKARPIDGLMFNGLFYFVVTIIKVKH